MLSKCKLNSNPQIRADKKVIVHKERKSELHRTPVSKANIYPCTYILDVYNADSNTEKNITKT